MSNFYIVTFNNTHEAMQGEDICQKEKVKITMMPTPTYITKSCGISLKVEENHFNSLERVINDKKLEYKSIYHFNGNTAQEVKIGE